MTQKWAVDSGRGLKARSKSDPNPHLQIHSAQLRDYTSSLSPYFDLIRRKTFVQVIPAYASCLLATEARYRPFLFKGS